MEGLLSAYYLTAQDDWLALFNSYSNSKNCVHNHRAKETSEQIKHKIKTKPYNIEYIVW